MRTTLRSLAIFAGKWMLAGLAFAVVLLLVRPDLRNARMAAPLSPFIAQTRPTHPTPNETAPEKGATRIANNIEAVSANSFADAVARAAPAVVNIYTKRVVSERLRSPFMNRFPWSQLPVTRQRVEASLGSGVIIDTEGHVVTNHHVIDRAEKIQLQLADGRIDDAVLIGDDPDTDLALLKIKLSKLPIMPMGRSDSIRVGDVVLAIGNPYGLSQTVTHGIISATGRDIGLSPFENFIQTDAAINEGNSGGALIDVHGELIGINTAALGENTGSEGIGFAIPVNLVRGVVEQILKYGHVRRGSLGVNAQGVSPQRAASLKLPTTLGAELVEVYADSPAARAGLHAGDVITMLNGKVVRDQRDAMNRVAGMRPGSRLRIQGKRDAGAFDVHATVEERK